MTPTLTTAVLCIIRSFSGDTGYECKPTASLMHNITFRDDGLGRYHFWHGLDGYASTILINRKGYFRRHQTACSDIYCRVCLHTDSSCVRAKAHKWRPQVVMRIMHLSSNDDYIQPLLDQPTDIESDNEPECLYSLHNHSASVYIQDDILTGSP